MHDEEELRRFIVAEVASQLKPFKDQLTELHEWQLAFWQNGSGRVKGLFQRRIEEDDQHRQEVKDDLKKQNDTLVPLVAYVTRQNVRQEMRDEFWKTWGPAIKWTARGIGIGIVGLVLHYGPSAIKTGWAIYQDYMERHQIKTSDLPSGYVPPKGP